MEAPTPPYAKYLERVLLACAAAGVAFGLEGVGYSDSAASGDLLLTPAFGLFILGLAFAVGVSFERARIVPAALIAIAIVYLFDALNLGFIEWIRGVRHSEGLAGLKEIYWIYIAPISAVCASLATAIVIWMRENSV